MTQHTPGPWTVQHLTKGLGGHRGYADWQVYVIRSRQNVALAEVGHIDRYESERIPANARLIAQAPAMWEVLHDLTALYAASPGCDPHFVIKARAVLAACDGSTT